MILSVWLVRTHTPRRRQMCAGKSWCQLDLLRTITPGDARVGEGVVCASGSCPWRQNMSLTEGLGCSCPWSLQLSFCSPNPLLSSLPAFQLMQVAWAPSWSRSPCSSVVLTYLRKASLPAGEETVGKKSLCCSWVHTTVIVVSACNFLAWER